MAKHQLKGFHWKPEESVGEDHLEIVSARGRKLCEYI